MIWEFGNLPGDSPIVGHNALTNDRLIDLRSRTDRACFGWFRRNCLVSIAPLGHGTFLYPIETKVVSNQDLSLSYATNPLSAEVSIPNVALVPEKSSQGLVEQSRSFQRPRTQREDWLPDYASSQGVRIKL